jgi:hypothetical protein
MLKKYKWIGPDWELFVRNNKTYRISALTDQKAERLLEEEPKYWSDKIEKVTTKKAKDTGPPPEE